MNGSWYEDKHRRSLTFHRNFCVPTCDCTACSGSGVYDDDGSPACGSCGGSGRMRDCPRSVAEATELMHDPTLRDAVRLIRTKEKRREREDDRASPRALAS